MPTGVSANAADAGNPAVAAARKMLAHALQIAPGAIQVVQVEEVQWSDGCLGVPAPDTPCNDVIVPGYRVILAVDGRRYVYHTDLTGRQVVHADPRP